jgi:formate dehydrogenase subunit gamma
VSTPPFAPAPSSRRLRTFPRFARWERWEHALVLATFLVLLVTGLPQKYRAAWGHHIITTPDRLELIQQIHHVAAVALTLILLVHVTRGIVLMAGRRLSTAIFPTWQDVRDAGRMLTYLIFLRREKPRFGKFNFEQKFTYWFVLFGLVIMVVSGFILWFPVLATRVLPGGVIPAAKLAHSTEAVIAGIFLLIWHVYHVHVERLNLSMFTGWLNEDDMRTHHPLEFERLTGEAAEEGGGRAP